MRSYTHHALIHHTPYTIQVMREHHLLHPDYIGKTLWDLFIGLLIVYR
jgi:hypothetical protein